MLSGLGRYLERRENISYKRLLELGEQKHGKSYRWKFKADIFRKWDVFQEENASVEQMTLEVNQLDVTTWPTLGKGSDGGIIWSLWYLQRRKNGLNSIFPFFPISFFHCTASILKSPTQARGKTSS